MKTSKCQVKLSKEVSDGCNEVLPVSHHLIYYIYIYIYIYTFMHIHMHLKYYDICAYAVYV